MEWEPQDKDKNAAWELYIELLTRITTQPLAQTHGDEEMALKSIHTIFPGLCKGLCYVFNLLTLLSHPLFQPYRQAFLYK
jgi:hypothetical protein